MSLLQKIKADQLQSRKDKNTVLTALLTTLLGEALMPGKNNGNRDSTDLEVIAVIQKFIKNAKEIMRLAITGDPQYLAALEEILVIELYLPVQLDEYEITRIAKLQIIAIGDVTPQSIGKIMDHFKQNYIGQYDGKIASKIVKELLNE